MATPGDLFDIGAIEAVPEPVAAAGVLLVPASSLRRRRAV